MLLNTFSAASENIVNQLTSMPQLKTTQTSENHEKKNKRENFQ